jgi:threonine dehydrogenase-like Zn-dependent dehydrogenase
MKAYAMLGLHTQPDGLRRMIPVCGPLDAICKTRGLGSLHFGCAHRVGRRDWGPPHNLVLGHEGVGEVIEVGELVRDFSPGDVVIMPAITPDWGSREAQRGYPVHSGGMLGGWKFSNGKDGVFAEKIHINEADANLALLP